jgi:ABC-type nickel/cobalt efflux system permease component RcnA
MLQELNDAEFEALARRTTKTSKWLGTGTAVGLIAGRSPATEAMEPVMELISIIALFALGWYFLMHTLPVFLEERRRADHNQNRG